MVSLIRVVIVEDNAGIAELHRRCLSQIAGIEIEAMAHSYQEAITLFEVLNPDLVLLDVQLPDGSGLDLLRMLRAEKQETDVLLITAARDVDTLQEAMRGGVVDYILKPVVFSRLKESIHKYLDSRVTMAGLGAIEQSDVDAMLMRPKEHKSTAQLPKGIDNVTLDKVRELFKSHTQLTAEQSGQLIGASRTTARRYLEYLISSGELEADLSYGTVGRPERAYVKRT
ncbi:response regulator [Photobacterium frigidiphilum]|uniref:response regulator n=1 Tax=Photobacterium frigidiphilum TaxID=264736 RepID=UPI001880E605|nr:response regulator [Photobacterium frigidiphilum]